MAASKSPRHPRARLLLPTLCCILALVACSEEPGAAQGVALVEVASRPQAYDGQTLRVRGRVHAFDDPRHYWLEDGQRHRIGLEPAELIAPHLGREVTIVGRYSYARNRGRRIWILSIEPYDEPR